jgi:hypothetical protein
MLDTTAWLFSAEDEGWADAWGAQRRRAAVSGGSCGRRGPVVGDRGGSEGRGARQTLHASVRRYAEQGLEGLADRSHWPLSCPHQMPAGIQVRLVELRQAHPAWGADRLLYRLERGGIAPVPSRAAVGRALARAGGAGAAARPGPGVSALGAGPADGVVADGCGGRCAAR